MKRLVLALWLVLASAAFAAPVQVKSGEHEGFTRLVLDFGAPVDWSVGRTLDGYELRLAGTVSTYDLTQAFNIIGKSRLAALWVDPVTTALHVGIACACHAMPFEFRPGIVVIDLRDGAPPKGSSFELALDGGTPPALSDKPAPRPRPRPQVVPVSYDWTDIALAATENKPLSNQADSVQLPPSSDPMLEPLRQSLLRQLSRGAAQGVVDMVLPRNPIGPDDLGQLPSVRIGLGGLPGLTMGTGLPRHDDLAAKGEPCTAADALEIASWGTESPVFEQMFTATQGLIGEFDKVDPVAFERAIKLQLFLGFGAEARQLLRAFPAQLPEVALWLSLARIVDGEPDPAPAFRGQAACDTPAALWAMLSDPPPETGDAVNHEAVLLAFSALPLALRRHLGPRLADRFFALDDPETASAIRNAILRAPGAPGPAVELLQAEIDMTNGDPAAAEARLEKMLADPGTGGSQALIAKVFARVAQDLPIDSKTVTALQALLTEQSGSEAEPEIRHALVLALAAAGSFDAAFAELPQSRQSEPDLWRILAQIGTDDAVLAHAVLAEDHPPPNTTRAAAEGLAKRLLALGLANPALSWLGPGADAELLARVHLARHDARSALASLSGLASDSAPALRAEALHLLNDHADSQAYAQAGDPEGQRLALAKARDWKGLAELPAESWLPAIAALAEPASDAAAGPLARGQQLAQISTDTRAAVTELLSKVAMPAQKAQ